MALEFRLPNGSLQHMTMINTPMFFAAMPRTFLDKMIALKPDPATGKPNPEALKAFAASHSDSAGQATFLADHNPPPSYANSSYYGIHTFKFINRENQTTLVRCVLLLKTERSSSLTPNCRPCRRTFSSRRSLHGRSRGRLGGTCC
jgi:catalase